jgi:hypothetical protein
MPRPSEPRKQGRRQAPLLVAVLVVLTVAACDREQPTTVEPPVVTGETAASQADVDALRARLELVDQHLEAALAAMADLEGQVAGDAAPLVVAEDELVDARTILTEVFEGLVPTATPAPAAPVDPLPTP